MPTESQAQDNAITAELVYRARCLINSAVKDPQSLAAHWARGQAAVAIAEGSRLDDAVEAGLRAFDYASGSAA